jgi:hypothetical protein
VGIERGLYGCLTRRFEKPMNRIALVYQDLRMYICRELRTFW